MRRHLPSARFEGTRDDTGMANQVTFPTSEGNQQRVFDLDEVSLPPDIKAALRYGIANHPRPMAHHTQEQYWYSIKTFAQFAEHYGLHRPEDLNTEFIERYRKWMTSQSNKRTGKPWSDIHQGRKLMSLRQLILTAKEGKPELLPSEIIFPTHFYQEGTPKSSTPCKHLPRGELKSLMWVCQLKMRETELQLQSGEQILMGTKEERYPEMRHALRIAQKLQQTGTLTTAKLNEAGVPQRVFAKYGGLKALRAHIEPTAYMLVPFVIALMVQLAGNVDPIRRIRVDCARTDEIDERWVIVEWDKPRGPGLTREPQRRFADRTKRYGAPALIEKVIALTESIRGVVDRDDAQKLFICETGRNSTKPYGLMSYETLKGAAQRFLKEGRERIARWNEQYPTRAKQQLGEFNLRDIRGSVAVQHYLASRGDIRRPQEVLNHRDGALTGRYIEGKASRDKNAQIISEVQSQIVEIATGHASRAHPRPYTEEAAEGQPKAATAAFTHECRSPEGNTKKLCSHFQQCLDCPGLVIPKTPESLARLLQAEETFREAKAKLHPERWQWLYARSYTTLIQRILPEFPPEMMDEARHLKDSLPPLPAVE